MDHTQKIGSCRKFNGPVGHMVKGCPVSLPLHNFISILLLTVKEQFACFSNREARALVKGHVPESVRQSKKPRYLYQEPLQKLH